MRPDSCVGILVLESHWYHPRNARSSRLTTIECTWASFIRLTLPVWGEIGLATQRFKNALAGETNTVDQRAEVADRWAIWREEKHSRLSDDRGKGTQFSIGL